MQLKVGFPIIAIGLGLLCVLCMGLGVTTEIKPVLAGMQNKTLIGCKMEMEC